MGATLDRDVDWCFRRPVKLTGSCFVVGNGITVDSIGEASVTAELIRVGRRTLLNAEDDHTILSFIPRYTSPNCPNSFSTASPQ
jgi:hypothetical protein